MFRIRLSSPADQEILLALWLRSVRASHDFLGEEDIALYYPMVRALLATELFELWVACSDEDDFPMGFMALDTEEDPPKLEALFVDPVHFRRGCGSALVRHAIARKGDLALDVNEQNPNALAFYRHMGFIQTGRSPLDGAGRPFPLIHMRLACNGKG